MQKDSTQSYRYSGKHVRYENIVKNSTYGIGIQQKKVTDRYRIKQTTYRTVTKEHSKASTNINATFHTPLRWRLAKLSLAEGPRSGPCA